MLDAFGRRRSSRSIPTGPGSRGGHSHEKPYIAKYCRGWRSRHPEYMAREKARRNKSRSDAIERLGKEVTLTMVCREIVREEVARTTLATVSRALGLGHSTLCRWIKDDEMSVRSGTIDVVVLTYTMERVLRTKALMRRRRRVSMATELEVDPL